MRKIGFTLPEVLLSLTIVGILAAITIPQIVSSVGEKKAIAIEGRALEQISLGCQNYIQSKNDEVTDSAYFEKLSDIDSEDFNDNDFYKFIGLISPEFTDKEKDKYDTSGWYVLSKTPVYIKPISFDYNNKVYNFEVDADGPTNKSDAKKYRLTDYCKVIE